MGWSIVLPITRGTCMQPCLKLDPTTHYMRTNVMYTTTLTAGWTVSVLLHPHSSPCERNPRLTGSLTNAQYCLQEQGFHFPTPSW